jgi:carbonic anhydrase/acetyltransferase-like protein (isoleucine patch superfamily)
MLIEHLGRQPTVDPSAYVAPTAVLCGDVSVGPGARILFGGVLTAEGGPVAVGANCIIMENAVLRGSKRHPVSVGDHVLVGPRAYLTGCTIEDQVFLATGATVFNGARVGRRSEVRINGLVHIMTVVPPDTTVPIGWVAVGDPAEILPPDQHERIWAIQRKLNFAKVVWGVERWRDSMLPEVLERYAGALGRHADDRVLG